MPQQQWTKKEERQYEHIKDSYEERGRTEDKAEELEDKSAQGVLEWMFDTFGERHYIACSFQKTSSVTAHLASTVNPEARFFYLDTDVLFQETYETRDRLAEALVPESDPVLVTRRLDETDEARSLLEERPGVGIAGARDIGPAIERAARGGRLDPQQFLDIWATLDAAAALKPNLADARRPPMRGGLGMVGMRERAGLLGGEFEAGPHHGGFRGRAVLPYDHERG